MSKEFLTKTDKLSILNKVADFDCSCSEEQGTGKDFTVCPSCMAGRILNAIAEYISDEYEEFSEFCEKNGLKCGDLL